jgi:hypothetical protein
MRAVRAVVLSIAKRCDRYLRTLLVQRARSSMRYLDRRRTARRLDQTTQGEARLLIWMALFGPGHRRERRVQKQ